MSKQSERLVNKAVSILTCDNPIPFMMVGKLADVLEKMSADDMALLLASEYAPEPMKWQDVLKGGK